MLPTACKPSKPEAAPEYVDETKTANVGTGEPPVQLKGTKAREERLKVNSANDRQDVHNCFEKRGVSRAKQQNKNDQISPTNRAYTGPLNYFENVVKSLPDISSSQSRGDPI
jgi:hypothetical protein